MKALAAVRYPSNLTDDVLERSGLSFILNQQRFAELQKSGMSREQLYKVIRCGIFDQTKGNRALGTLIGFKFTTKSIDTKVKSAARSGVELKNNAPFPLTGLRVRYSYKDKDKKVLYKTEQNFSLPNGKIPVGGTARIWASYHPWTFLKTKVGDTNRIKWWEIKVIGARNGAYLNRVALTSKALAGAVSYTLKNNNTAAVRKLRVRAEYLHTNNKPFVASTGVNKGRAVKVERLISAPLGKGQSTTLTFKADPTTLGRLGIAPHQYKGKRVRIRATLLDGEYVINLKK